MKVVVPTVPIEDNLPQVPGITVEVHWRLGSFRARR